MVVKAIEWLTKFLGLLNKLTEVVTYILTGYSKLEDAKEAFNEKLARYARYIIIGACTGIIALLLFFVIRAIVKKCKERKEKKLKKQLENQLALEV